MLETGIKVLDAMRTKPIVCKPDTTLLEAAKLMKKKDISSIIVIDSSNRLAGIVTEKDFLTKAIVPQLPVETALIKSIMTKNVVSITPEKDIFEAMVLMNNGGFRRLPVVDSEKGSLQKVVGILTIRNILELEPTILENFSDKAEIAAMRSRKKHKDFVF